MLPLEILLVVPLDDGVFNFTDSVRVTEDLEHTVSHSSLLSVVAVRQNGVRGRLRQQRGEPLDGVNVYHTLHVEQIYCYLYRVSVAYLIYWLDVRSVD